MTYLVFTTSTGLATRVALTPATTALRNQTFLKLFNERRFLNVVVAPGQMCGDALLHPALAHQVVLHSVVHHSLANVHNAVPAIQIKV